jgi:hypothetical protein
MGKRKPSDRVASRGIDDSCATRYSGWKWGDGIISRIIRSTRWIAVMLVKDRGTPVE